MKKYISFKKIHIGIIFCGTLFIFLSIFHKNLWFDEAYSVGMANQSFIDIWKIGANDVHPVLYYYVLKIINSLTGGSIICYRIFSSIPIFLIGLLGITHIKRDFGEKTGIIFSYLSFFLPTMAVFANEIRMYSWTAYLVTIVIIYAYRIYRGQEKKKDWIIFEVSSLCSIYFHYYGVIIVCIINIYLLVYFIKNKNWNKVKYEIFMGVILILTYIPWITSLFVQITHVLKGFWIGFEFPKTLLELIGYQMSGIMNIWIGFIANIVLVICLTKIYIKKRRNINLKLAIILIEIYLLIILIAAIISIFLKTSILYYRYLFIIIGLYIFIVSYILSKEENNKNIIIICLIIFLLGTTNLVIQLRNNYSKENGKQIEYLKENIKKGDIISYTNNEIGSIFAVNFLENKQYFYNPEDWGITEAYKVWLPQMETYINEEFLYKCTDRVWIIDSKDNKLYNMLFNNENFKYISSKIFETPYQKYVYNIILVERVK